MVAQEAAYHPFRMWMRTDRAIIRNLFPPRIVQSVYFDTWRGRALEENLAGISHREKVRFRWYGEGGGRVRGTLERKVRHNMLGWKQLLPIEPEIQVEGATRTSFRDAVFSHLTEEWSDVRASHLLPVQWIRYSREYYTAGTVRVTLDRDLRTYDQRLNRKISSRQRTATPRVLIVEAKCDEEHYGDLREFLNRMPLQVDKCSKFVYASSPSEGAEPSIMSSLA